MNQIKQLVSQYKNILIGGVVVVGVLVGYNIFYLTPKKEAQQAGAIRSENQNLISSEIGREIVATLNRLKSLNIDPDFFLEERFQRLMDFSVEIKEQPVGKNNPFSRVNLIGSAQAEVEGVSALEDAVEVNPDTDTPDLSGPGI
ncbi:MAG: hypothetical protein ACKKL4_00260 [Patescibacteria group bacterium]